MKRSLLPTDMSKLESDRSVNVSKATTLEERKQTLKPKPR